MAPPSTDAPASNSRDQAWLRYEKSVATMLDSFHGTSEVLHNAKVPGRLSTVSRQVDVSVRGAIAEIPIFVAVECKMYGRPVNVGEVDSLTRIRTSRTARSCERSTLQDRV
jgi:hypothetical protein